MRISLCHLRLTSNKGMNMDLISTWMKFDHFSFFAPFLIVLCYNLSKMIPALCRFLCIAVSVGLLSYRLFLHYPIHSFLLVFSFLFNSFAEWKYCNDVRNTFGIPCRNLRISVILSFVHTVPSIILSLCHSVQS